MTSPLWIWLLPLTFGCIPTNSPDDLNVIEETTIPTTTTNPNDMCQLCPNPYDCSAIPTGAVSCDAPRRPVVVTRVSGGCETRIRCRRGSILYVLDTDGVTWIELTFIDPNTGAVRNYNTFSGICRDSNPAWICDGLPRKRIVCATKNPLG